MRRNALPKQSLLAWMAISQSDFGHTIPCLSKPVSPNRASWFLGDPETMEYGDFDNVRHECKDNRPHQRSSQHK